MRIALLNTYPHGGAGTACLRLAEALHQEGAEVRIITRDAGDSSDLIAPNSQGIWAKKAFMDFAIERLHFLPHEASKEVRFSFSIANTGQALHQNPFVREADVIHLHWINQGFISLPELKNLARLGKPMVWTLHDMWAFTGGCHYSGECQNFQNACGGCPYLKKPGPGDLSHRVFQKKAALFPSLPITFVTCSEWLKKVAESSALLKGSAIHAIPNPIDTTRFRPLAKKEARQKWSLPTDKKLLLFAAMNTGDKRKGFSYLLESLHFLKNQHPALSQNLELVVMGKIEESTLADLPFKSHLLGMVQGQEKIVEVFNAADLFVIPSLEDNLPNTVMESLACGTPVVGFDIGGIPEMVDHQITGFVAPPKSASGLAQGIVWLFDSEERMAQIQGTARQKVEAEYAYLMIANRYFSLYKNILKW